MINCPRCQQGKKIGPAVSIPDLEVFWICGECEADWPTLLELHFLPGYWDSRMGIDKFRDGLGNWGEDMLPLDPISLQSWLNRQPDLANIRGLSDLAKCWAEKHSLIVPLAEMDQILAMEAWRHQMVEEGLAKIPLESTSEWWRKNSELRSRR